MYSEASGNIEPKIFSSIANFSPNKYHSIKDEKNDSPDLDLSKHNENDEAIEVDVVFKEVYSEFVEKSQDNIRTDLRAENCADISYKKAISAYNNKNLIMPNSFIDKEI